MNFFNVIRWLAWKDLLSEMRSRENISSMFFFALIVILIFSFSFSMDQKTAQELMPGIMWVAFIFTGIIGLGKSFTAELQNDCLEYLQMNPIPRGAIYLGKLVSNLLFMLVVELILFPLFVIFFNLDIFEKIPLIMLILITGTLGVSAVGTLFSAMTVQIRAREVMLPILLLPLIVPVIIGAVEATGGVLQGQPVMLYRPWIELLTIFDVIFTIVSFWVFEFILDY
ncbi:MAG TPA: heme exporter protein CcmB [Nitrospiria bacterium]|nr:heme exporter protein CcmB [Nitrospiria bacterium]